MLKLPCIIINYKTYTEASGKNAKKLSKKILKKDDIYVCPQTADIHYLKESIAQHIDSITQGQHTGSVSPETLKQYGCIGSLINHSEKPLELKEIKKRVNLLKQMQMVSIVCTPSLKHLKKIMLFEPDIIAYEPPELIGGEISVSTAKPEIIKKAVEATKIPVIVGAGIKNAQDILTARKLGAQGVLVSSGIVKAYSPENMIKGFLNAIK